MLQLEHLQEDVEVGAFQNVPSARLPARLPGCLPGCPPGCPPGCLPACLPAFSFCRLPARRVACRPASLPSRSAASLPACAQSCPPPVVELTNELVPFACTSFVVRTSTLVCCRTTGMKAAKVQLLFREVERKIRQTSANADSIYY